MIDFLKRFLSPEYLVVTEPGPLGGLWIVYLVLGLLFALGLAAALWILIGPSRKERTAIQRAWAWFELWICLVGLVSVIGRFRAWPGWSARIWPYSLSLLALAGALVHLFRDAKLPRWLADQFHILALSPATLQTQPAEHKHPAPYFPTDPNAQSLPLWITGLLLHLLAIALVLGVRYSLPAWLAPLVLLVLLLPQAPLVARRRLPRLMALTPLLAAYLVTLLWLMCQHLGITVIGWQGLAFPNPMVSLFYVDGIVLASGTYAVLCQLGVTAGQLDKRSILWRGAVVILLTATLAWAGVVYFGKRTHGATASDPYAYAQMGVDLADRGTFLHRISLFEEVMPLNIAWAPLQPVGYHIPRNEQGDCPSVWATGASALLAAGYLLLGETGLYVTTPIIALLALAATWALVQEALRGQSRAVRYVTGALAVVLLATSPEHVDRLLVPMADAPAQLFTVLTLFFALRGMRQLEKRQYGLVYAFLAGICFAWAYWVRHTQIVLALPVLLAILFGVQASRRDATEQSQGNRSGSRSTLALLLVPISTFALASLLMALPDIVYRWRTFGGPLTTETTELPLMHLRHIGPVAWQMLRDSLAAGEWGYLFPLALYGGYRLVRDRRREAIVLGSAFVAVLLVHLTYQSLRLRDLISLFPLVDLAVAYGAVALVRQGWSISTGKKELAIEWLERLGSALFPVIVIAWIIFSLALARWAMVDNLWKRGWASFGYMRIENREAFDRLADLTPADAIIGASLNAGAVMLHSDRDAIRPYDSWTADEWDTFVQAMHSQDRPIYLLDDGGLMAEFIAGQQRYRLTPVEELLVPLFYTRDRDTGWLYYLERDP